MACERSLEGLSLGDSKGWRETPFPLRHQAPQGFVLDSGCQCGEL